ncbi:hypothetical protein XmelCFBP4644_00675 [Xanthomonas melonis]|uniref:Uncharacterized protein n=1 Tax=Xanthomonas melonis TaxID=56456 RepID=A0A2S7DL05_9XANT|nr:hypothetical protein XmelCFBP4644_00675 [Xanthomonas melonis]
MTRLKQILVWSGICGVCALCAFNLAYWWALSGQFDCVEGGCGLLAELVLWPILSIVLVAAAAMLAWVVRRRRGRR